MGWEGVNESESIRDFNFCGTKILRTGGRLKINPGKKRGYSYEAVYNRCISQFYVALFLKPLHKKTYVQKLLNVFYFSCNGFKPLQNHCYKEPIAKVY